MYKTVTLSLALIWPYLGHSAAFGTNDSFIYSFIQLGVRSENIGKCDFVKINRYEMHEKSLNTWSNLEKLLTQNNEGGIFLHPLRITI